MTNHQTESRRSDAQFAVAREKLRSRDVIDLHRDREGFWPLLGVALVLSTAFLAVLYVPAIVEALSR